jgi:hypothetical protein
MFMIMDDVGALIWRFGKNSLVSSGYSEHAAAECKADHKEPAVTVHSPAAE